MFFIIAKEFRYTYVVTAVFSSPPPPPLSSSSRFLNMSEIDFYYGSNYLSVSNSGSVICLVFANIIQRSKFQGTCLCTYITRVLYSVSRG